MSRFSNNSVVEKLAHQVQWYDKTPVDICGTWGDSSAHALLVLAKRALLPGAVAPAEPEEFSHLVSKPPN